MRKRPADLRVPESLRASGVSRTRSVSVVFEKQGQSPTPVASLSRCPAWGTVIRKLSRLLSLLAALPLFLPVEEALSVAPQVAAGGYHGVPLRNDGTVLAWGSKDYGLGVGSQWTEDHYHPVSVTEGP